MQSYSILPDMSTMKRRLDFRIEQIELDILEKYCKRVGRTKTDVLREFIRSLNP